MTRSRNEWLAASDDDAEEADVATAPAIDIGAIAGAVARRWKLIACLCLAGLAAAQVAGRYMKPLYKSTVELLVYDPQRQIDSAIQKPISPFVNAIGYDAISTEVSIIKSKSVALRVATELSLDKDPEFNPESRTTTILKLLGLSRVARALRDDEPGISLSDADRLDRAADTLMGRIDAWPNSYIISVSATSQNPAKAQVLAQTIATDYLSSQREARQEALQRVATWLKDRVDSYRLRLLETEAKIERLQAENGIRDLDTSAVRQQQTRELTTQLTVAREEVTRQRAHLEQARRVIDSDGDIQSIPEFAASQTLASLRQTQTDLRSRSETMGRVLGQQHAQVVAARSGLAAVNGQIATEAALVLKTMQNAFDIAQRQEKTIEASLDNLVPKNVPEVAGQLQQLRRFAETDRALYESYLSQYNDISERRMLQDASARIISTATLPRSPTSTRGKLLYGLGGAAGLGAGVLLALLSEFRRRGFNTSKEVEHFFGRPVVGVIPLVSRRMSRHSPVLRWVRRPSCATFAYASEAVHAMRINLDLLSPRPKVILITSSLPSEGKTTTARLLAASGASAGMRTVLVDCDLHQSAMADGGADDLKPGLSDVLRGRSELSAVLRRDMIAKHQVIPAGASVSNAADWLMSARMRKLIDTLRGEFDYIVLDAPPLLPVVDALALSTLADKVLVVVAWSQTPRRLVFDAMKILRPEAHRIGGIVLNKIDFDQMPNPAYGSYRYRPIAVAEGSLPFRKS